METFLFNIHPVISESIELKALVPMSKYFFGSNPSVMP